MDKRERGYLPGVGVRKARCGASRQVRWVGTLNGSDVTAAHVTKREALVVARRVARGRLRAAASISPPRVYRPEDSPALTAQTYPLNMFHVCHGYPHEWAGKVPLRVRVFAMPEVLKGGKIVQQAAPVRDVDVWVQSDGAVWELVEGVRYPLVPGSFGVLAFHEVSA